MKRLGIGLVASTLIVVFVVLLWPTADTEPVPRNRAEVRARMKKKVKIKPLQLMQMPLPSPAPAPKQATTFTPKKKIVATKMKAHSSNDFLSIDEQVQSVLRQPLNPPTHMKDDEVAVNRGVWKRNRDLEVLQDDLVHQLQNETDAHVKLELQVALAEVYAEQVETLALYEAPSAWDEDRALKWHEKVETQIATAEDKAAMLLRISEEEAGSWPDDDPIVQKLQRLQ